MSEMLWNFYRTDQNLAEHEEAGIFVVDNNVDVESVAKQIDNNRVDSCSPGNQVETGGSVVEPIFESEEELREKSNRNESSKNNSTGRTDVCDLKSNGNRENNTGCEKPTRSDMVKKIDVTAIDIFPYNPSDEEYIKPHQTLIGTLGTIITAALFAYVIVNSLQRFAKDDLERNTKPRIRTDEDSSEIGRIGMILFHNGKPFYDESFFRINYRYRAIYNGDMENDVRPRVYVNIPSKTCLVYHSDESPGKNATFGCPDVDAARRLLASEKERLMATSNNNADFIDDVANFPLVLETKGQYGSNAYWFLEVKLNDCASYGKAANITCANTTQIQNKFIDGSFNFDFVMSSQISRTESLWRNLYMEIELDRWTGVETYLQKIHSFETDRFLQKTSQNYLNYTSFHSFTLRANRRQSGDPFYTFYIRLHDEVQEEKLAHYSFLDMITDIGGAWEVIMISMTFGFIGLNYLSYKQKQQRMEKEKMR